MASAGTLIFQLAADVSQLRTDMQKAQGTISESLKSIQESTLAEAVMTGMEYATEFAKGFAEKIAQAIEQADAMGKMAQKIGASTEALSGLAYAGQFAGVQMDDLALGFKGLEKSLLDARDPLSNSAAAFRALGLNVKDLQAENPADAFKDIATAFSKFQDGAQKAAVATEVFGKQGVNLIPLLNQGAAGLNAATAEAEKLGLVISQDTADAMGELSDNMHRMSVMSEGAAAQLAQQLEPAFEFVIDVMRDFSTEGTALNSTLKVVAETIRSFIAVVYGLGTAVGSAGQFLVALDGAMTKLVTGQISMKDAGEQIGAAWQKGAGQIADANTKIDRLMGTHQQSLEERVAGEDAAWGKVAQRAASTGKAVLDYTGQLDANAEAHRKATEKVSDYERMLESLSEQLRKAAANGDVMQELMTDPKFAKMTKDQQQNLMDLTTAYVRLTAAQKQQTDQKQAEQKVIDEADKAWVQHIETLREYAKTVKDAIDPTQVWADEMDKLAESYEAGFLTFDQLQKAQARASDTLKQALSKSDTSTLKSQLEDLQRAVEGFGKKATDAFVDFIFATKGASESFGQMISDMLADMAKMLVYQNVMAPLFKAVSGGGATGWISGLAGLIGGGRMSGGPVSPGFIYPVNELPGRKEYFIPSVAGNIVTDAGAGGMGGGTSVAVNVHLHNDHTSEDTKGDSQRAIELGKRISAVVKQTIANEKRTGGLLAPTSP